MNYWIFRGNREDFDIDAYLKEFEYIYWAVKHKQYQEDIDVGDKVFIWRSKGKSDDPYGVIAFGTIAEVATHKDSVKHPEFLLEQYWQKREVSPIKVGIKVHGARLNLETGLIDASLLLADDELSTMQLLTARQGTNFKLTPSQFQKIFQLWGDDTLDLEEDEYETEEGKAKLRLHKIRERDRILVRKAKERFIRVNGGLFCEACHFSFSEVYGINYVEAHHKKPLSQIRAGEKTKESDLGMLCANCHRAVHRIESEDPWRQLLNLRGESPFKS
jgi:hypothetical protein